jgi:hypothetical protein
VTKPSADTSELIGQINMTETVTLVATLNAHWRLLYVPNPGGSRSAAWHIQCLTDDRAGAFFRVAEMVRSFVMGRCGPLDAGVADILAALPPRSDRDPNRPAPKYVRKRRPAKPVEVAPAATVTKQPAVKTKEPKAPAPTKAERLELIKNAAARKQRLPQPISEQRRQHRRWAPA